MSMIRLELKPHSGIGPIRLGAKRDEVRLEMARLEMPLDSARSNQDFFGSCRVQVEYEDDGSVSFIGVSSHANLALEFEGIDLFDTEAEAAFFLLAIRDGTGDHAFSSFEYILPAQIVTFYEADFQYDHRQGGMRRVWGQIGCGDQRYLNAILKIQDGVLNPNPPEKA